MMRHKLSLRALGFLLLGAAAISGCAGTADGDDVGDDSLEARKSDLEVVLTLDKSSYAANEPVLARVTITNVGRGSAKLLNWTLPAADLEEPVFRVETGGHAAEFTGPHYKRPTAGPADFVHLASGASLVRTVDLGAFYDLSRSGDYALRVDSPATSNTVNVRVDGRVAKGPPGDVPVPGPGNLAYTNCDATQQGLIATAKGFAQQYSDESRDYLTAHASSTQRYTTWFGAFNAAGRDKAHADFVSIADAFANAPQVVVDCKCKKTYYAYVYPNQEYKIYVCKAFWSAPTSGTDSKAGTLVHEMSHFNVTAATNDNAYGKTACMDLAISNPDKALDNADSHEYFAENTPALP